MGSSAPWRFELIISPCVPVQMVPVCRVWSCTSKATPSMGSSVTGIIAKSHFIINIIKHMHKIPNTSVNSSKTLHKPSIQVWEKDKASYWASVHRKRKVPERPHPSHVSEVMWSGDVQACGCSEGQGCISVTCGCLCRRRAVPVMDAFFPSPFLPLFFFILSFFFIFSVQELIRGHCLGMVTRADNVTHKYFCRNEKAGL
jgi:hypothetical protein